MPVHMPVFFCFFLHKLLNNTYLYSLQLCYIELQETTVLLVLLYWLYDQLSCVCMLCTVVTSVQWISREEEQQLVRV